MRVEELLEDPAKLFIQDDGKKKTIKKMVEGAWSVMLDQHDFAKTGVTRTVLELFI